jgi:hypothetical protein
MNKRSFYYIVSIVALFAALAPSGYGLITAIYAQEVEHPHEEHPSQFSPFSHGSNFTFGDIASIQNDQSGKPTWIAVGHWKGNLLSYNQTNNAISGPIRPTILFSADFRMLMLNGSATHSHAITNFNITSAASYPNGTKSFNGTTTISTRDEGHVTDVPTTIKVTGQVISIFPDPSKIDNHFGSSPVYGIIEEANEQQGIGMSNSTSISNSSSAGSSMMGP